LFTSDNLIMGVLTFTVPLMAILGVHELGHFFMARRRKVAASLPFFIPSFPPLGTFGAFISLRDPIPNRKALLEIGVAGPLCGLALAIPLGILGLILTNDAAKLAPQNVEGNVLGVSFPLLYILLEQIFPIKGDYLLHPTAFAAWVGILVTAINLLPVGQLDGGHIARALLGDKTRYLSWAVAAVLLAMSLFYFGWILFAMLVILLGVRHPPPLNDISPLGRKRAIVGVLSFVVLIAAFVPAPLVSISQDYGFELTPAGELNGTIVPGGTFITHLSVDNTGNTYNEIDLQMGSSPAGWRVEFKNSSQSETQYTTLLTVAENASETARIDVRVTASEAATIGDNVTVELRGTPKDDPSAERTLALNLSIVVPSFTYWVVDGQVSVARGSQTNVTVMLNSTEDADKEITLTTNQSRPMSVDFFLTLAGTNEPEINVTLTSNGSVSFGVNIAVGTTATIGNAVIYVDMAMNGAPVGRIPIDLTIT
jgi:Zn-dependent protease